MIERCGCCGVEYGPLETHAARDCARRLRAVAAMREHRPRKKRERATGRLAPDGEHRKRLIAAAVARARAAA